MKPVKEVTLNDKTLKIFHDEYPETPREFDNFGKMLCFHKRYDLGDAHTYKHVNYNGWDEMKQAIIKNEDTAVILPLFLLDHSGITISTKDFNDRWDSGQIGWIIVSKKQLRKEYSVKRITQKLIERATEYLIGEVETYDTYLRGEVYRFVIEDTKGEQIDSCSGFFGDNFLTNGILDYAGNEFAELLK